MNQKMNDFFDNDFFDGVITAIQATIMMVIMVGILVIVCFVGYWFLSCFVDFTDYSPCVNSQTYQEFSACKGDKECTLNLAKKYKLATLDLDCKLRAIKDGNNARDAANFSAVMTGSMVGSMVGSSMSK